MHPLNKKISKTLKQEPHKCTDKCKYWAFSHRESACILSDVFSVEKGEMCYEFNKKVGDVE